MGIYAIGHGKCVEFREAPSIPKRAVSSVSFPTIHGGKSVVVYGATQHVPKKQIKISMLTFKGGKVLGTMLLYSFNYITGLNVNRGQIALLPAETAERVLRELS
jgi:hypothetical protein